MLVNTDHIKYLQSELTIDGLVVHNVSRMRCSTGILNIITFNGKYQITFPLWSSFWTKKYNELTPDEFHNWCAPKVLKHINNIKGGALWNHQIDVP